MENRKDLSNIFRVLFDDNVALPCNRSPLAALANAALTNNNSNAVSSEEAIAHITMNQWGRSIGEKFPIEPSAKRMLSFDNNDTLFQSSLGKIFNISSKLNPTAKTSVSVSARKNLSQDNYPKKRQINMAPPESGNVESTDGNKFKTDFKSASGKNWDDVVDKNNKTTTTTTTASSSLSNSISSNNSAGGNARRNLGLSKPTNTQTSSKSTTTTGGGGGFKPAMSIKKEIKNDLPEIKGIEPKMVELILNEILDKSAPVDWDDVAGLEFAKNTIKEIIIWPMLRPDIFKGLRGPPKGVLLFGPPGTGKTLIGKCIASKSKATFFSISASSLTSKWVGEGEKMVRSLFAVAKHYQPAVIFIDEIDSLLTQRCDGEHESSRRIKTEFLVQLDGCGCFEEERILVIGATNRPQELDEAARRRLVKKLYIPLPEAAARTHIIKRLLQGQHCSITDDEIQVVVSKTDGYSGADVTNLCKEAAIAPLRTVMSDICTLDVNDVPPIGLKDFESALQLVKSSVSPKDLHVYRTWNDMYGTMVIPTSTTPTYTPNYT